jgi:hypothetical protein
MTANAIPPPPKDDTRAIVIALRDDWNEAVGAAKVWRWLGGVAVGLALTLGGVAVGYARDAAVDHEIVLRHEREIDAVRDQLDAIRSSLAAQTAILERVERRLDREDRTP